MSKLGPCISHNNMAQQGTGAWNRVISPPLLNTVSLAVSRLSMTHTTESAYKNDIVTELRIGGLVTYPRQWGAPYFNVQGFSPFGDRWLATPMSVWGTLVEGRQQLNRQAGRHSLKFGGGYQRFISHVGIRAIPRQTLDLGWGRDFSIRERARFETRAEFFNALNHTNLGTPNRFVNTSSFGSITEVSTPGREIQLSARLSF